LLKCFYSYHICSAKTSLINKRMLAGRITKWLLLQARNTGSEASLPQPEENSSCAYWGHFPGIESEGQVLF